MPELHELWCVDVPLSPVYAEGWDVSWNRKWFSDRVDAIAHLVQLITDGTVTTATIKRIASTEPVRV